MIYLDASVLVSQIVIESSSVAVDRFLDQTTETLLVSEFAAGEVASAVSRMTRTKLLALESANRRLADFDAWRVERLSEVELQAVDVRLASLFIRRFDLMLRMPDALHTALCRRVGATLATMDVRLAKAAQSLSVPVHLIEAA